MSILSIEIITEANYKYYILLASLINLLNFKGI